MSKCRRFAFSLSVDLELSAETVRAWREVGKLGRSEVAEGGWDCVRGFGGWEEGRREEMRVERVWEVREEGRDGGWVVIVGEEGGRDFSRRSSSS